MSRPSYKIVDNQERNAFIASRNDVLYKSFAMDLWLKVISRAIDDLVIYGLYRAEGKELKDDEKEYEASAYGFLFDEEYTIPLDDYPVIIQCLKCEEKTQKLMSLAISEDFICSGCKVKVSSKTAITNIVETKCKIEVSLNELLSYLGMENPEAFRSGCEKRIRELINKRRR
jgi:hypothetical protein